MSYLKTFQKFADRPLRPGLEEEEVLVSEDAPPETAPGAPQAEGVPSLDTQVQTIASDLFPNKPEKLDLPDPFNIQETPNVFKETFGSPESRKQLALEVASNAGSEVFKGYDKLMSATDLTLETLPGNVYSATEATAEVLPYLTNEPVSDEARKVLEGTRAVKDVMTIDDVVTNAVSSRLEKRFVDAAQGKKQGRNAYRSFLDSYLVQAEGSIRETLGKEEGELTRRDAERTLARYVDAELKSPSNKDAGTPLFILARRAAEDANQLATSSAERRILGGTVTTLIDAIRERDPGLALREAGLLEATPEDERKLSFRERFFDAPGALMRLGTGAQFVNPTLAAKQRLDEVSSTLSQRVVAEDIAAEGQKAPVGTLLGADILRLAIKSRDVTFDFDPEFKAFQGPSREDVEVQFYSKAVSDEQQQRRLLENSRRTGVPVEILYGISRVESANQPTGFAYNLHIDAENRTAEQNEKILTVLREIGLDPETKKRTKGKKDERPTSYYGDDARKVFSVVFSENPASAVRGGAWGQFQILGQRGSGNFVDMMREIAKRDRGEDITEDEAAAFAVSAFKSQPTLISDMLLSRWFNNNKVAVDAAKNQDVQKLAEKYFGAAVSDVERTRRKNWVRKVTENRDAYIEQMARSPAAVQAQTERNKAANTETFAPGDAPVDAKDRDFVNVLGSGPTFTKGREGDPADAVADAIEFDLVRVEGGLVEQTSAFADLKEYPIKGGQNWVDSTDQFRVDEKESPLMAQMDIAKSLPPSDSFAYFSEYYVAPALREAERVAEREGRDLNETERRKVVSDARKKAFLSAISAQTAQYWRQPFYVSAEFLEAVDVGADLPEEMPTNLLGGASLFDATFTPQIEVLGRTSRNGIAYRSETPTIVTLNSLDALPYYGMSFNMGFVGTPLKRLGQDVYNDRASLNSLRAAVGLSPAEYAEYTNDPAASLGKLEILGAARNLWNNGVRGVQSRQNPVEALAFFTGEVGAKFAGTAVGNAVMEEVLEQGFLPKRLNSLSDDARRIALVDSARAYGTLVGILPGFIIAMKSPDGINALIESSRVAGRASRTFRALATVKGLADYIEPMGNINYARLVYKVGLSRSENVEALRASLLTLGEAEASGDVTSTLVLSALGRLEDTIPEFRLSDRVDATLRKDYPGSSKELDAMLEARLGMKSGQDDVLGEFNGAKNASDTKLAQTVYERMLKLVDQYETAADPVKREAAERLRVLLTTGAEYEDAKGKKQFIKIDKTVGLSPGSRDAVLRADGAESAATVFDTATQLEALYLGLRLAEPVSDAEDLRLSVFLGGMANPIQSLYGAGAKVLRGEKFDTSTGLAGALEFYKPVEKKAFEASLEASNLTDDAKNLQRQKFDQLTEFHTSFLEAVNNGTILDPQIVDSLRRQFMDTKLFEAPPIMFSGAEVPPGLRNQRYRSVVDRVFEVAGSTQSASTDANLFQRSLAGLMETAEQRGQLLRDLAMKPYDGRLLPESMGATPTERLLTFLSPDGGYHRLDRMKAAVRAGFGEARLALRSYSPLSAPKLRLRLQRKGLSPEEIQRVMAYRTDVDLLLKEQLIQDLADGRDDITVAKMIRTTVENQLAARLAAVDENSGVAEALRKELEMVRGDDWNRNLLTWIRETTTEVNNAVKENRAPQTVPLRLPTAVNPIAIGLPETNIAPLPATQSFFKRLYADAFSKMPPTEVAEPLSTKSRTVARKLQRAERYAEQVILDQMFRAMAGVTAETDMLKANDAVEKMLSDTILNIRAVRSKKERALRYNAVRSRFVFAVAQDLQNTAANNADKEFFNRFLAPHLLPVANQPLRVVEEKKLFDALVEDINEKTSGTQRARLLQALNASSARALEVVLDTMDPDEAMLLFESTDDTLRAAIAAGEGAFEARRLFQKEKPPVEVQPALAPEFYSRLRQAVEQEQQKTFTPDQLRARLRKVGGVKQDEIDQVRLDEFLSDKTKVTKAELLEWLDDNAVEVSFDQSLGDLAQKRVAAAATEALNEIEAPSIDGVFALRRSDLSPGAQHRFVGALNSPTKVAEATQKAQDLLGILETVEIQRTPLDQMLPDFDLSPFKGTISEALQLEDQVRRFDPESLDDYLRLVVEARQDFGLGSFFTAMGPDVLLADATDQLRQLGINYYKSRAGSESDRAAALRRASGRYGEYILNPDTSQGYNEFLATVPPKSAPERTVEDHYFRYKPVTSYAEPETPSQRARRERRERVGAPATAGAVSRADRVAAFKRNKRESALQFLRDVVGGDEELLREAERAKRLDVYDMRTYTKASADRAHMDNSFVYSIEKVNDDMVKLGFTVEITNDQGSVTRKLRFDPDKNLVSDTGPSPFPFWDTPIEQMDDDTVFALSDESERMRVIDDAGEEALLRLQGLQHFADYGSPHFVAPNIVAHMRTTDRLTPDGKRILFIEEIQSDWHQEARRADYEGPRGPFAKSWPDLMLKKALRVAAEGGYDGIALTRGDLIQSVVGGELSGQRKFYDEILPKKLKKLIRGPDGQLEGQLEIRDDVISPGAKDRAVQEVDVQEVDVVEELADVFTQRMDQKTRVKPEPVLTYMLPPSTKQRVLQQGQVLFQRDDAPLRRRRVARAAPTAEEGLPVEDIKRLAKSLARKERKRLNAKSGVRSSRDLSVVDRENGALKRSLSTASAQASRAQDAEAAGQNPRRAAMLRKKAQDAVRTVLVDAVEEAAKTALPDAIVDMAAIFKADEAALNALIESPDRIQVLAAAIDMASTPDKITPESITPFFKLLGELGLQDKVDVRRLMTYTGQPPKVKAAKAEEVEAVAEVPEVAEAVEAAPKVPEVEPVDVAPIERAIEEVAPEPVPAVRAEPEVVPEVAPEAAPEVVRPEVVTEDQPQRAPDFLSPAQVERREALLDREPLLPPEPIFSDADELAAQLEMLRSELPISDLKIRAVPFQSDEESPVYGRGKFVVNPEGDLLQFDNFNQLEEARPYVVLEIDGVRVPFYQSTGTGGKLNQTGVWYPIFGVAPGGWLVKGKESDIADYYGSRKLAIAADFLDAMLGNVRPLLKDLKDKVTTTPFPRLPDTHQEFLNAGRVAPAYDATADVRNNAINSVLAELGEPPRYRSVAGEEVTGRFGTGLSPDKPEVVEVYPDTAATAAGVQKGDVILAMNGDEVKSTTDVMRKLITSRPGDEVAVTVLRDGEKKRLNVTLGRKTTEEAPAFDEVAEVPEPQRQAEVQKVVRETPEVIVETIPARKAARKDATKKSAATFAKLPKPRKSEKVPKAKRKKVSPEAPAPAPKAAKPAPKVTATKAVAEEIAPQVSDPVALREFVDSLAEKLEGDAQVLSTFVENFGEAGLLSSLKVIVDPDISDVVKYDFATNVVRVSDKAVETGTITQNMIGELWGALSRYISDESVAALRLDYARSQRRMRALADRDPTMAVFADMDFDSWVVQTMAAETLRQQRKDLTARRASEEAARNVAAQAKGRQPEAAPLASEASLSVFQALHSLVKSILRRLLGTSKVTAEEVYTEVLRTLSADEVPEPRAQSLSEYFDEVTKAAEAEVVAPKALDAAEEDVIAEIVEGASNHMVEKVVEPVVAKLPEVRATEDEVAETVAETTPVKTLKEEPVDVVEEVDVEAPIGGVAVRGDQVRITPATTSLDALTAEEKARKALELPGGPTAREQMAPKTISKKNWSIILREAVKSDLDRLLSVNIIDTLRSLGVTEADEEVISAAWIRAQIQPPVLTGKRAARKPRKPKARSLKIVNEDGVVVGFAPRVVTPLEMRQQREARKPAAAPTKEAPELSEAEAQQVTVRDPFEALEALSPIEASAFLEGIEMAVEQPVTIRQVLDSVTDLMPEGINQRTAVELIRFTLTGMARRGEIVQAIQPDGSLLLTPGKPTGVTPLSERFLARTKQVERQKKLTQDAKKVEKVAQKAEEVRAARIKADDVAVVDDTPLTARQEDTVRNRIARLEETATPAGVVPALAEITPDARARLIEILTELPRTTALPSGIDKSQRVQVAKTLLAALEFVAPYIRFPEGLEQLRGLSPKEPQVGILRAVQEGLIKKLDELVGDDVEAVVLNDADTADLVARAKASGQLADTDEAAQAVTQARKHASRLKNTTKKGRGAELEAQLTDADVPEVETSPLAPSNINDLGEAVKALNLVAVSPGTRAAKSSAIAALRRIEEVLSGVRGEGARKGTTLFVAQTYGDNLSVKEIRAAAQSRLNAVNFFVGMGELPEPVVPRVADPDAGLLSRANIWGSTPRAKAATPEQVSAFVDDYFEALDEGRPDVLANSPEALQFQTNYGDAVTAEIVRRRGEEVGAVPTPKPEAEVEAGVAARAVAPEVKPLTAAEIDELVLRHPPSDEEFAALDNLINYYGGLSADALRKRAAKYGIEFDETDTPARQNMFLVTELAYADWRNVRRNNLIAAQDTKVRTVPMPEAPEDMTPAVLRVLKGLQPGNITRAVERGERLNKLILGAKNIQDITKEDILEVVFADLNIEAKNKLLRSRDLEVFRNDVVQTVESRLAEVAKEVNSLRQRAVAASRLADAQGTSEADQKRRKSLEGIAQEYNRAADAFELALEQAKTEGIQAMESALRALEPKALTGAPNVKGMVYFLNDSSAIIYALRSADATTGLHEVSHILRRKLNSSHQQVVEAWVNSRLPEMNGTNDRPLNAVSIDANGRLTGDAESVVMAEELFAEAFEQYLREGVTPNPKLATVFETIKMLFQKILAMLDRSPEPIEISAEMYQLFDEVFGGVAEIRAEHLPNTGRYLNNKNLLLREGDERPLMRITPQGVVEETSVDRYRQFVTSLSDYRSRYPVLSRFGERAPGPGSSDIAAFSGPITRRTSIESRLDQSRVREAFLQVADFSAVATASMVEAMVYHLIGLGDDPVRSMRSIPPVMRSQLMGAAREIEEGINVISSVANDISRRVSPASKARAISDLARALEGLGVELQTGAQRGRRLVAPNLNSAEGIFDLIRNYVLVLDKDSLEALRASAEVELLRGMGVPVQLMNQRRPLTGFWSGLKSKAANFKEGDTYEAGLHVRDDIPMVEVPELEKASVAGDNVRIESTTQDMLQDVARALTGQQTGITPEAEPGLRRLAAVLLFYAGVVDIRRGNQPITADDLVRVSGKSRIHLMLEGVEDLNIEGMDISVDGVFRGLTRLPPDRRSLAAMTMGVYGALRNVNDDTRDLGLGIQAVDYRAYLRYISGLGASMSAADIGRAERVRKELGLQVNLAALETRLGKVYVPRSVRAQIVDDVVGQARRQLGLTDQKAAPPAVQYAIEHVMRNVLFGNTIVRQLYATAQQIDIFRGVASAGSFTAGLAAFLRTAPVAVLEMPLFSMGLIPMSPSRAAETLDVAGGRALTKWVRSLRRPSEEGDASVRAFKQGARDAAASLGDRFASAVTEFFSAAKYRVEVSPILEANPNTVLDINGVLYRASDLRRIFVRSGMYSNPFKMLAAANRAASRDFLTGTRVDSTTELSKDNANALESAQNVVLNYLETNQGAAYRGARNAYSFAFEHGAEAMDAFSDYERTGAAVSFMELGISPGYAARLVVQGLYDYRGSMTAADRSFFRRVLMPFFAFRKNAMTHTINLLTSPRGVFMIRALERVPRMTAEAITAAFFETAVGPYGVDVSAMNPYQRDIYYSFRDYFEFGLGEDASDKELDKLREQLPEDQRDMPREELLRYSFNGWTALDGFGGYQNVPEDFKLAVRGLIANSSVVRGSNQIHIMNLALFSRDARRQFAEIGSAAVRPLPSQAGLPGYAAQRYPTIQMFLPTMTPNLIEAANRPRGAQASMYLSLPDSMIFSGMEQIVASMATVYVTSLAASHAAEGTFSKADTDAMLNALEPVVDFRGIGGPVPKLVFDGILNLRGDETAYMELHPIMARMWEGTYGMPPSYEGTADFEALQIDGLSTETNLMLNRMASLPTMGLFGTLMPMTGVEVDKNFKSTRLGKVVVREGRREVEYLDRPGEYLVPDEEGAIYRPFLVGMPAVIGKMVRFGEVNRLMLAAERAGSVQELAQIDEDLKNLLIGYGMEAATKAGFRVFDYDEVRTSASVGSQIPR